MRKLYRKITACSLAEKRREQVRWSVLKVLGDTAFQLKINHNCRQEFPLSALRRIKKYWENQNPLQYFKRGSLKRGMAQKRLSEIFYWAGESIKEIETTPQYIKKLRAEAASLPADLVAKLDLENHIKKMWKKYERLKK